MKELIVKNQILEKFPHRTEADFYIWISRYKNRLFQDVFIQEDAQSTIESYIKSISNPIRHIRGLIRRFLGRVRY